MNLSSGTSYVNTVSYKVGNPGVIGTDYNFTSVANATKQTIQLGTSIIPGNAIVISLGVNIPTSFTGGKTWTMDFGQTSGGTEYSTIGPIGTTGASLSADSTGYYGSMTSSASSMYLSVTPSANWSTLTIGYARIWITYLINN